MVMVSDYRRITMQTTIGAGDFKTKCLKLLDDVAQTKEPLVITKRGRPVAKLVPIQDEVDLYGALAGSVISEGNIISPLQNEWTACK